MTEQGRYIVIEGGEGAGKSSAMAAMEAFAIDKEIPYKLVREPGGSATSEALREILIDPALKGVLDPRTELLLMYASRIQLIEEVIKPTLAKGIWVIADRCEWSSKAYQGAGRGLSFDMIESLSDFCVGNCRPDAVFFLDIKPEIAMARVSKRGAFDRIEQESMDFFNRVYQHYLTLVNESACAMAIDATQSLADVGKALDYQLNVLHQRWTHD